MKKDKILIGSIIGILVVIVGIITAMFATGKFDEFKKEEVVDWKEIRHYVPLSSDCFESVFLGVNILPRNKEKIIDIAKKLNPNIEICQITLDPEAFRLKGEPINI